MTTGQNCFTSKRCFTEKMTNRTSLIKYIAKKIW